MTRKRRLGFSPAVHRERAADALYLAREGVKLTNKDLRRNDCDAATRHLIYTARNLGAAQAEKAGAKNSALRTDSFRALNNLQSKLKSCYAKRNKSRYERDNED